MHRPSHELPQRELLSAYFDGEASLAERAEAERLLAEDPDAAAWLAELSDLRSQVQTLPRHRLEDGFCDQVIRRAERAVLLHADKTAGSNGHIGTGKPATFRATLGDVRSTLGDDCTGTASAAGPLIPRVWHAPTWLAAAASFVLCTGLLLFATRSREQAVASRAGGATSSRFEPPAAAPADGTPSHFEKRKLAEAVRPQGVSAEFPAAGVPANKSMALFHALPDRLADDRSAKEVENANAEHGLTAAGHILIVCDVAEPPGEAFGRFENWLRGHRLAKYSLAADNESESPGLATMSAAALEEGKGASRGDTAATRLYYVNVPRRELAQTLRSVARVANGEISVSSLGAAAASPPATRGTVRPTPHANLGAALLQKPGDDREGEAQAEGGASSVPRVANREHRRRAVEAPPATSADVDAEKFARERREASTANSSQSAAAASSPVAVILVLRAAQSSPLPTPANGVSK